MQQIFALWQEQYAGGELHRSYLESAVDDDDPVVLTFAQWFAMRRHILEYPRRREYTWLTPKPQPEGEKRPLMIDHFPSLRQSPS